MDPIQYLRGLARGLTADVVGTPADIATQATNLGIAGGGYLAHKLGLVQTPPDLLDPTNVPLTSDWFVKNTPLQGEGAEYNLGRMTPAIVSMGRAALNPDLVSPTSAALRSPSPEAQRGALYIDKNGQPGAEDLALYHNTNIGAGSGPARLRVPQELRNLSQAVSARGADLVDDFGPNYLVPNPKKFEPVRANTILKPSDFYTPRRDAVSEANYETTIAALNTDPEIKALYDTTRETLAKQLPSREASDQAFKIITREVARKRALARITDRTLANTLPAGGAMHETVKAPTAEELKKVLRGTYGEIVTSAPQFRTYEQFDKSPYGGARLRNFAETGQHPAENTDLAEVFLQELRGKGYDLGSDPRFGTLQDPSYVSKEVTLDGNRVSPKKVESITKIMRDLVSAIKTGPSQYAELKKYGPTPVVGENFPAFMYRRPVDQYLLQTLRQKNIKPYDVRGRDAQEIFDLMTRIQTNTLRGQPLP